MSRSRSIDDDTVLDRAVALFWQRGYAATSMRDLSGATGLGAAALYNRYGDKDRLFVAALRRYADQGLGKRLDRLSRSADPLAAISAFLEELISMSVADADRRGCLLVNTVLDGAATSQEARDLVRERLARIESFFRAGLARARDSAAVGPQVDPDRAAEMLLGTVLAIRVMARLDPEAGRLRRLAENALASLASAGGSAATTEQPKR